MKKSIVYIALTISTIFWGVSFVLTKQLFLTEPHLSILTLITLRLAVATIVMVPTMILLGKWQHIRKGDFKWVVLLAFCEPFVYNFLETTGVKLVSSSLASIIIATIPIGISVAVSIVYHEPLRRNNIIGILLSLLGVAIMLGIGSGSFEGNPLGILTLFAAVIMAAIFTLLLVKVVANYSPLMVITYQNLFGFLFYLPIMLAVDHQNLPLLSWSPRMILLLLGLGIFCSSLAYGCYNYGVKKIGAASAGIFNNAIPVFTMIVALLIGQETISLNKVLGMFIAIGGVILSQYNPQTKTIKNQQQ